ncbi:MAG: hypothetical protein LBH18_03095 [Spirochaetaceae bacterium]|jgi:hypothetical protein|nr:hypothetical protein [Spirochaetaceae bacterium]
MAKKCLLVLLLAGALAGGVFADWYNSYAPGIAESKFFINAGLELTEISEKNKDLPPFSASVEYALLPKIPLSIGGHIISTGDGKIKLAYLGAKASWHFNFVKNFDPYISLVFGWLDLQILDVSGKINITEPITGILGARYFFTNNIGAYLELGTSKYSHGSIGLSVKF